MSEFRLVTDAQPVGHLIEAWLVTFTSSNTRSAYRRDLELFVEWLTDGSLDPRSVTATDVAAFRDHCAGSGSSPSTTNRRVAAVASFYRHAGPVWSTPDPTRGVVRDRVAPRPAPPLSAADAAATWRAAVALGHKTAAVVGLTMLDGLTTNELLQLDIGDLIVSPQTVVIDTMRRGGLLRLVVDPRTGVALRHLVSARTTGPLLVGQTPTGDGARLTRFGVDYLVKRVGTHAGLDAPLTVTTLRRTQQVIGSAE